MDHTSQVDIIFIDFRKALYSSTLNKLSHYGIQGKIYKLVKDLVMSATTMYLLQMDTVF